MFGINDNERYVCQKLSILNLIEYHASIFNTTWKRTRKKRREIYENLIECALAKQRVRRYYSLLSPRDKLKYRSSKMYQLFTSTELNRPENSVKHIHTQHKNTHKDRQTLWQSRTSNLSDSGKRILCLRLPAQTGHSAQRYETISFESGNAECFFVLLFCPQ